MKKKVPRSTASFLDGSISVDRDFFKVKNQKRRDTILQHEIGHSRMKDDSFTQDGKFMTSERHDLTKYATKKYAKGGHSNSDEFEADRYAANRTSEKDLKAGIRDIRKYHTSKKGIDREINKTRKQYISAGLHHMAPVKSNEKRKEMKKVTNKLDDIDYNSRSKALKDKELRESKIYKKD